MFIFDRPLAAVLTALAVPVLFLLLDRLLGLSAL